MTLQLHAVVAERGLDVALEVGPREVLAVLGPNGAGKSSLLHVVAGLLRPDRGRVVLDGRTLLDAGGPGGGRVWVPPHARGVALLAQEPLLFPHLTALHNVAFGPRSTGTPRREAVARARRWLAEVDAAEYADRRPGELSGGQAQRVAVARALAAEPRLLLLDEPIAALDVAVAPALRQMLRRVLRDQSAMVVTHDALDALLLADRVVVLEEGRVVEEGRTADVLSRPRSAFAARIAGLNMVRGTVRGHTVHAPAGVAVTGVSDLPLRDGAEAVAVFRPSAVAVHRHPPGGSVRNVVPVTVTELEPRGDLVRVRSAHLSADVTPVSVAELDLLPGAEVLFAVKAGEVAVYPA
jgi:molybdate transport system ATP-binding protein